MSDHCFALMGATQLLFPLLILLLLLLLLERVAEPVRALPNVQRKIRKCQRKVESGVKRK